MKKRWLNLGNILGVALMLAVILGFMLNVYSYNHPREYFPSEGVWYCEELGIQIRFGEVNDNFVIKGNNIIYCQPSSDRGSSQLSIVCQDSNSQFYELGETVFSGKYVDGNDKSFSMRESNGTKTYTFVRRDDYVSTPATQFLVVGANSFSVEEINTDIASVFSSAISNRSRDPSDENIFNDSDWIVGKTLEYDLYCKKENRVTHDLPYYDGEMYVYIVITAVDSIEFAPDSEAHIFGFCVTYDGMHQFFYEEMHSSDKKATAFLQKNAEYLGSFSMCVDNKTD